MSEAAERKKQKKVVTDAEESFVGEEDSPSVPTKVRRKKVKAENGLEGETGEENEVKGKEDDISEKSKASESKTPLERSGSSEGEKIGISMSRSKSKSKIKENRGGKVDSEKGEKAMVKSSPRDDGSVVSAASSSRSEVSDSVSSSPRKDSTGELVRSNLMSPLTRIRQATGRSRSGSSPARRQSAAQIRAQVQAETEKLAKAGNATAKRILHRAKSESEVSMNSWDLGSTAGLRVNFNDKDDLLARATAAATKRSNIPLLQSRQSALRLPDTYTPRLTKDSVAEQLLAPMRHRPSEHKSRKSGHRTGSAPLGDDSSPRSSSSIGSDDASSPSSTPRSPSGNSKRSLASFGRKTSYHSLGRTSSGFLPSLLTSNGNTTTSNANSNDTSTGDKAKSIMESFLRFISSHLSNHQLCESIALMHSVLVPSTFLLDHMQVLFKLDSDALDLSLGNADTLRKDIVNFIGTWVTAAPTDFVDDFVLEKKLKDWILSLMESNDTTHISYSLLLQNIVNQAVHGHEMLRGRVLSDKEILEMAEASKRGLNPGDVIAPTPIIPSPKFPAKRSASNDDVPSVTAGKKRSSSREDASRRVSSKSLVKSPSFESPDAARQTNSSPPPFSEPSFENMVDLARRVSTRDVRSEVSATHLAVPSTSSPSTSPRKQKSPELSRKESKQIKSKTDELPPSDKTLERSSSGTIARPSHGVSADADELSRKPKISKKLLGHLSEQIGLKEAPLLLNISVEELAKQWTLLDHQLICQIRSHDILLNVSKPSRSPVLTDIANKFNSTTCWVAVQILKIPNVKKRALAVAHMIALAEILLNLTNLHGFIAIITGLSQHAISRLTLTWKKVDPSAKRTFDALVNLASPIGNFKQLRTIHDNALPPFVPTPAMFLRDLLFVIDGNGGSFAQASVIKTEMILLSRKVLSRIQCAQQASYKFYGIEAIQNFIRSGTCLTNEELDSLSEKVESGRDM